MKIDLSQEKNDQWLFDKKSGYAAHNYLYQKLNIDVFCYEWKDKFSIIKKLNDYIEFFCKYQT